MAFPQSIPLQAVRPFTNSSGLPAGRLIVDQSRARCSATRPVPSRFTSQTLDGPPFCDVKPRRWPSGDQAGSRSGQLSRVAGCRSPASVTERHPGKAATPICPPALRWPAFCHLVGKRGVLDLICPGYPRRMRSLPVLVSMKRGIILSKCGNEDRRSVRRPDQGRDNPLAGPAVGHLPDLPAGNIQQVNGIIALSPMNWKATVCPFGDQARSPQSAFGC